MSDWKWKNDLRKAKYCEITSHISQRLVVISKNIFDFLIIVGRFLFFKSKELWTEREGYF